MRYSLKCVVLSVQWQFTLSTLYFSISHYLCLKGIWRKHLGRPSACSKGNKVLESQHCCNNDITVAERVGYQMTNKYIVAFPEYELFNVTIRLNILKQLFVSWVWVFVPAFMVTQNPEDLLTFNLCNVILANWQIVWNPLSSVISHIWLQCLHASVEFCAVKRLVLKNWQFYYSTPLVLCACKDFWQ